MTKMNLNAVFYSKGNVALAYTIKRSLWEYQINVSNISEFSELVYQIHQQSVNILLIDCETVSVTNEVVDVTKGSKLGTPDNVIFVGSASGIDFKINNQNRFLFAQSSDLLEQLRDIEPKIKFNIERGRGKHYDMQFVNTYLTQYLIQLGFYPKYAGFNYIKHSIEEALNNNGVLGSLSTQIYPVVARRNQTHPQNVERNIRNSIECAHRYSEFKDKTLRDMVKQRRVSNRAFLSYLLDQVVISHEEFERNKAAF